MEMTNLDLGKYSLRIWRSTRTPKGTFWKVSAPRERPKKIDVPECSTYFQAKEAYLKQINRKHLPVYTVLTLHEAPAQTSSHPSRLSDEQIVKD